MKKQTLFGIVVSALFLFFGNLPVSAQSQENMMTVQIPFDFLLNEKLLPAGKYLIKRDQQAPQILMIYSRDKNIGMIMQSIPHSLPENRIPTSLVFTKYDDQYFLSEVRLPERGKTYTLSKSKAERRQAQIAEKRTINATPKVAATSN